MDPWTIMMCVILVFTPFVCLWFSKDAAPQRVQIKDMRSIFIKNKYYLHVAGYFFIIYWKRITDSINEPLKLITKNWTGFVYGIEGDFVYLFQRLFSNQILTDVLNFHYLFIYLFIIYVTTLFYAYVNERDLCDKVTMNYLLIYALAVPYYLFFNVEVTSSWIPQIDALLYHDNLYSTFYIEHDPLDNAIPSLHIAIPFGILMINYLHVRENGIQMKSWKLYRYHRFILFNTWLFIFSILYLGIHWLIDIPLGAIIGGIGGLFIHYSHPYIRNPGMMKNAMTSFFSRSKNRLIEFSTILAMSLVVYLAVNVQSEQVDYPPTIRLGLEDTLFEIVQPHDGVVDVQLSNYDSNYQVSYIIMSAIESETYMNSGVINWFAISESNVFNIIEPDTKVNLQLEKSDEYRVVIFHNPDSPQTIDVGAKFDYGGDKLWLAYFMSIPSMWMTGFVFSQFLQRRKEGLSWQKACLEQE